MSEVLSELAAGRTLEEALTTVHEVGSVSDALMAEACVASVGDGRAGAADSACTRTVAGEGWLENYLECARAASSTS
eukprot:10614807-Alexandrium_andersonii.AAC.1